MSTTPVESCQQKMHESSICSWKCLKLTTAEPLWQMGSAKTHKTVPRVRFAL
jgi:hypothetical protein